MPTIEVSDWVKEQLDRFKQEGQHKSYDSVIRELILVRQSKTIDFRELLESFCVGLLRVLLEHAKKDKDFAWKLGENLLSKIIVEKEVVAHED